ncbi:hypothetical protein ACTUQ0_15620, partial [Listeria monocytogenes]|uniref:hypothetical protein n=1 Tax=Listeria monocytogenes TaxID=1639 RepID=UPI003FA4D170
IPLVIEAQLAAELRIGYHPVMQQNDLGRQRVALWSDIELHLLYLMLALDAQLAGTLIERYASPAQTPQHLEA